MAILDKKLIVTANFNHLTQEALLSKMQAIANNLTTYNKDFPNPSPAPTDVLTQLNALRELREGLESLHKQQQSMTQQYHQLEKDLTTVFVNQWVPYVQQQAAGDAAKVLETGFGIKGNEDGKGETSTLASFSDSYPLTNKIDTQIPLQHRLNFINSNTTHRAKPYGADRIEIFEQIGGERPKSLQAMKYVGSTSKAVFINHFDSAEAGQIVHYAFRYVSTQNQPGIDSPIQSAIISG